MATSPIGPEARSYGKLPLSQSYYEKKDKLGEKPGTTKSSKVAKKTLVKKGVVSSSSSSALTVSSSSSSNSSSSSQELVSKVSHSIISGSGAKELNLLQGLQPIPDPLSRITFSFDGNKLTSVKPESIELVDCSWLNTDQLTLLQDLFKAYALDDQITLYDLFGLHLYTLLEAVKKKVPSSKREKFETEVIEEFSYRYLVLYLTLDANRRKKEGLSPLNVDLETLDLDERYFVKELAIPSYLDCIESRLVVLTKPDNEKDSTPRFNTSNRARLQSKLQKKPMSIDFEFNRALKHLILFKQFLKNSKGQLLVKSSVLKFPSGALIKKKDALQTRDDLIKWVDFLKKASSILSNRSGVQEITLFANKTYKTPLKHLPSLIVANRSIRHASLAAIYKDVKDFLPFLDKFYLPSKMKFLEKTETPENNKSLISEYYLEYAHGLALVNLSCSIYRIANMYIPNLLEENYVTPKFIIDRLRVNAALIFFTDDNQNIGTSIKNPSESLSLQNSLTLFQDRLQSALTPLLLDLQSQFATEQLERHFLDMASTIAFHSKCFADDLIFWPNFVPKLEPLLKVQESFYSSLYEIREKALSKLSFEEPLSKKDRDAFSEVFFQAMRPFFPFLFFMNDVQIFLEEKENDILREEQLIPQKMANLIIFDEQDFPLGTKSIEEDIPSSAPSLQKDDRAKSPEPTRTELPEKPVRVPERLTKKEIRSLEKLSVRETPRETPVIPIEELPLRTVNKTRKLIKLLKQAGYMPKSKNEGKGRGSHRVLKNDTGKITVVSKGNKNKEIPKGTLRAIERQVVEGGSKTTAIGRGRKKHKKGKKSSSLDLH